uniref:Uncharacterized protein n=1 Tax=Acanthochromis polyacanthus TaxID=80966 RepID=A0A3Q1GHJ3_9TELE
MTPWFPRVILQKEKTDLRQCEDTLQTEGIMDNKNSTPRAQHSTKAAQSLYHVRRMKSLKNDIALITDVSYACLR